VVPVEGRGALEKSPNARKGEDRRSKSERKTAFDRPKWIKIFVFMNLSVSISSHSCLAR